jgi:hypothetical protein
MIRLAGGGGGGLATVTTDTTLTGNGSAGLPLGVKGWPLKFFSSGIWNTQTNFAGANSIGISGIVLEYELTFGNIAVNVQTSDASNNYDIGIYTAAGALVADIGPRPLPSTGFVHFAAVQGIQTIAPGLYLFAFTGITNTAKLTCQSQNNAWISNTNLSASTGAQLPSTIAAQTPAPAVGGNMYFVELY